MPLYTPGPPPPMSLQPGGVGYSFGTFDYLAQTTTLETIPAAGTAGSRFALTQPAAATDPGSRTLTYGYSFNSAPSAVSVSLQVADQDVDSAYVSIDTMTTAGTPEIKTVSGVRALFARLILNSITANGATTMSAFIGA